jgi:hypothetical protein
MHIRQNFVFLVKYYILYTAKNQYTEKARQIFPEKE